MVVVNFISECYLASLVLIVICLLQFSVCTSVIFVHSFPWIGGSTGFLVVRWGKSKNFVRVFWTVLFSIFVEILFSLSWFSRNCSESDSFCLQVRVFYAVRLFLGLISVVTETILVYALSRKYGKRLASYTLAMLCLTSGCFFASTSAWPFFFLPGFLILVLSECYFSFLSRGSCSMK